jgi:hypothetical protein
MIPTVANLGVASHGLQLKGLDRNATQIPGFRGNLQSGDFCIARSSYILYWMELVIHVNEKQNTLKKKHRIQAISNLHLRGQDDVTIHSNKTLMVKRHCSCNLFFVFKDSVVPFPILLVPWLSN